MFADSYSKSPRTRYDELTPYAMLNDSILRWLQKQDDDEDKFSDDEQHQ